MSQPQSEPVAQSMNWQFVRFFIVGVGATLLHLGIYKGINVLMGINESQALALNISYSVAYALSFIANYLVSTSWTFRTSNSVKKGAGFAFAHAINYGLHLLFLNIFVYLKVGELIASMNKGILPDALLTAIPMLQNTTDLLPIPIYVIVVPVNFLLVRFFLTKV